MKRIILYGLALAILLILMLSCSGPLRIDQNRAIDLFLAWLIDEGIPQDPDTPMAGLLLAAVPEGSVVSSFVGYEEIESRGSGSLQEPGWLFYLDQSPGALYQHPGKIAVIGVSGSVLYTENTVGWPLLNGQTPNPLRSVTSDAYFQAIVWNPFQMIKPVAGSKTLNPAEISVISKGAIVINGVMESEPAYTEASNNHARVLQDMQSLFTASKVRSLASPVKTDQNPVDRIKLAINQLIVQEQVNRVTIYICAHGGIGSVTIGGYSMTALAFKDSILRFFPDIHFSLILESCYSGNYLTRLSGEFAQDNLAFMIAASMWNQSSYTDNDSEKTASGQTVNDHNPEDAFVEWTGDFLLELAAWSSGEKWIQVQQYAREHAIDTEIALFYHCFWSVKGAAAIPPPVGFDPADATKTIRERRGLEIQTPRIYARWVSETPVP